MNINHATNNIVTNLGLVLICVLASIGFVLFEGISTGILFFTGYFVIAAVSSAFKEKRYFARRALD
ncbi:hypothetical protein [Nitrosomonas sp.]|uniref:hypothetical protein n=1 Tax=Nitrosomonas sp. TaxID=42353 RepID=UPI0025E19B55|nr:hypothetical protein [Nitrosomonas sp.]